MGYDVVCYREKFTAAEISQRGVRILLQEKPEGWIVESMRFHRPNVVSCEIVSGHHWTPLIGAYLPESTLYHLSDLEKGAEPLSRQGPYHPGGT